ncbi:hypothetical protein FLM44_13225 [Pseudoalteromonas luteoviolacea]|nr:hypothetical protein FLM44_13225 [Pseudoalteromonas luteoviolacea]
MIHHKHVILDHFMVNDWVIDCKRFTATRAQLQARLEPKAALILQYLASRPGEVISREELFQVFWPNQVVTEDALNRVISTLRKTLNDSSTEPQYIATIRKSGYRLVAEVKVPPSPKISSKVLAFSSLLVFLAGALFIFSSIKPTANGLPLKLKLNGELHRLTYSTKTKHMPHLSEDAKHLTYLELDKKTGNTLVLMSVSDDKKVYYHDAHFEFSFPIISPASSGVFSITKNLRSPISYAISLTDFESSRTRPIFTLKSESTGLSYHPQSKSLVFTQRAAPFVAHKVTLYDPLLSTTKTLSSPPTGQSDTQPIFSPSGKKIAFLRSKSSNELAVYSVTLDGKEQQLTQFQNQITAFDWLDNNRIVFSNEHGVFLLTYEGKISRLFTPSPDQQVTSIQLAYKTNQLLLTLQHASSIGKAVDFTTKRQTHALTLSNGLDSEFAISPNAAKMAFASTREGYKTLWFRHNNHLRSINNTRFDDIYDLAWSDNSEQLAAVVKHNAQYGLLLFNFVTDQFDVHWQDKIPLHVIGWDKHNQIWHAKLTGQDWTLAQYNPIQRTTTEYPAINAYQARFTLNKESLIYIDATHQALWTWDFNSAPKKAVLPQNVNLNRNWDAAPHGIYYVSAEGTLNHFNVQSGVIQRSLTIKNAFSSKHRPQARLYGLVGTHKVITYNDFWLSSLQATKSPQ